MAYKNKTYVAFDADSDMIYYRLMTAWKQNDYTNFNFYNAHDLNVLWPTSQEKTIKEKLIKRLNSTKIFVLLVGEKTKFLYKFVRWEIEQALKLNLPIIIVNINGARQVDIEHCPPILRNELALHISFNAKVIQKALEEWEELHKNAKANNQIMPFSYKVDSYNSLGL